MALRDLYSGLGFFEALPMTERSQATANGTTIDLKDYDGCVFEVHVGSFTGNLGVASGYVIIAQVGLPSAAGVSVWSDVAASMVLDSVVGEEGAYSTITGGVVWSIVSTTDSGTVKRFGLRNIGERRYARLQWSADGAAGNSILVGATAILGYPHFWPVDEPVGINAP